MTCADIDQLLSEYVEGTLGRGLRQQVEAHLEECAGCRQMVADAQLAWQFVQRAPEVTLPPLLTNSILFHLTREASAYRSGLWGWLERFLEPVLQPRFAMGMAMTILSISLLGRFALGPQRPRRWEELHPVRVWSGVQLQARRVTNALVRQYEDLRVVWEIRNRLEQWAEQVRNTTDEPVVEQRPAGSEEPPQEGENP